jgi:hypothetical protein
VLCTLDEYLKSRKRESMERGVFGQEYHIEHLTLENRAKVLALLSSGPGFID